MLTSQEVFESSCFEDCEKAVSFEELKEAGWSIFEFTEYCSLCELVRANAIVLDEAGVLESIKKVITFLDDKSCIVEDAGDINEYIAGFIVRYWSEYCAFMDENVCSIPKIYRTSNDFRKLLELFLFTANLYAIDNAAPVDDYLWYLLDLEDYIELDLDNLKDYIASLIEEKNSLNKDIELIKNNIEINDNGTFLIKEIRNFERLFFVSKKVICLISYLEKTLKEKIEEFSIKPQVFDRTKNTLYVHKGKIKCIRENHKIENVNAEVKTKLDGTAELNVQYCSQCNNYFVNLSVLEYYREQYGLLIGDFKMVNSNGGFTYDSFEKVEYHPLRLCGYTVAQKDGLSNMERRYILAEYIGNNDSKKREVIDHLTMLIETNGQREINRLAALKWISDRDFVLSLDMEKQRTAIIDYIKSYNREEFISGRSIAPYTKKDIADFERKEGGISVSEIDVNYDINEVLGKRVKHSSLEFGYGTIIRFDGKIATILFDNKKSTNESIKFDLKYMINKNLLQFLD